MCQVGATLRSIKSPIFCVLPWALLVVCACLAICRVRAGEAPAEGGTSASTPGGEPSAAERRRQMAKLRAALQSAEGSALSEAIAAWRARGDTELPALTSALRHALTADAKKLDKTAAGLKVAQQGEQIESALAELRAQMRARIAILAQGAAVDAQRADYEQAAKLLQQLVPVYSRKHELARLLGRRSLLLDAWRQVARHPETQFGEVAEERLRARCVAALGSDEYAAPPFGQHEGPLAGVWFYRDCRAIEAYNAEAARKAELARGELENIAAVNAYRETLGLLPLEIDVRLVKAARGHSQEMARLGYFSHDSPTAGRSTFTDRMRLEGYQAGGGENILQGAQTGQQAFWIWFESPGHHRNMAAADFQSIGVGQHGELWTQNFGMGERAMLGE